LQRRPRHLPGTKFLTGMLTCDLFAVANLVLFSQQYAFFKTAQKSNSQQSATHTGIVLELYFRNRGQYSSVQSSAVEQVFDIFSLCLQPSLSSAAGLSYEHSSTWSRRPEHAAEESRCASVETELHVTRLYKGARVCRTLLMYRSEISVPYVNKRNIVFKFGEMSCFNQHNAVEFEYNFASSRKVVHLCFIVSHDKMIFAVLEL